MNTEEAIKQLDELRRSSQGFRHYYDSWWLMAKAYAYGSQWAFMRTGEGQRGTTLRFLRNVTDPQRTDLRVTHNKISELVTRSSAAMAPARISYDLVPRSTQFASVATTGHKLLNAHLDDIGALKILRAKEDYRNVLGCVFVRRTLRKDGLPAPENVEDAISDFKPGWALVPPTQILRDPSARSVDIARDEVIFAQETPRTVKWVEQTFGVKPKTKTTMGNLVDYNRSIRATTGCTVDSFATDSKEPGVLVYECYYKVPGETEPWSKVLFAYLDTTGETGTIRPLADVQDNPFYGLPFHMFSYSPMLDSPWPRGIPHILAGTQDIHNIMITWMMRLAQEGSGKWRYEEGTIDADKLRQTFNNRLDRPIAWRRVSPNSGAPDRVSPPQINPAAFELMNATPQWMLSSINMDSVQFGQPAGRRGESGEALSIRLGEANAVLESMREDDDQILRELLFATFVDLANPRHTTIGRAKEMLDGFIDDEAIRAIFRKPPQKTIQRVSIHPSTVRPQTRGETKNELVNMVGAQMMDANTALRELAKRGVEIDSSMSAAYKKQTVEISAMIEGEDSVPAMPEDHETHMWAIRLFVDTPEFETISEEAQDRILGHFAAHLQAQQVLSGQVQQNPQQGTPPAQAVSDAGSALGGAVAPLM